MANHSKAYSEQIDTTEGLIERLDYWWMDEEDPDVQIVLSASDTHAIAPDKYYKDLWVNEP